jgi:penicillin-binding protein 1A
VQPGSTAKLPLLVAACDAGKKPHSRVLDAPLVGEWPSNGQLGYKGETTLIEAFASSRNAAAVRLTREIGVSKVAEVSRSLGIDPGATPDVGFVLGSFSTNVLGMTAAYAAVANGGYRVTPTGVLAVVDGHGHVRADLLQYEKKRVISQKCIEPTRAVLNEVVRTGTGTGARLQRWKAYGKTGTTTGNADAWFIGWSEGRVLGTWMGKRRDAAGEAIAGKGAPAEFFRRVSNGANEMAEYRSSRQQQNGQSRTAGSAPSHVKPAEAPRRPERKLAGVAEIGAESPLMRARRTFAPEPGYPLFWDREPWDDDEEELFPQ